ncbi:guanine nucleotide-binding protein subunit beta-like protein 1 isoform X2 [Aplysia californica]|uniref:Guanine nucleotide-binding protein subunit beta-like protein 1 isoform X2 n=1 Tax=Aplysia californica TaxID=6500 RepID=A0ABM1VPM0_APLCA|nr:guanine nucleotide-binding protein subunit beta-like protein 1 isoform X2 [Aplysia californica]
MTASSSTRLPPPDPVTILCDARRLGVYSLIFGPQGTVHEMSLFSGHEEGLIIEWSLVRNRPECSWNAHGGTVLWMDIRSMDGNCFLFSQGRDGTIKVWSCSCGLWTPQVEVPSASMLFCNSSLAVTMDKFTLAAPSEQQATVDLHHICSSEKSRPLSVSYHHFLRPDSETEYGMCMKMQFCPAEVEEGVSKCPLRLLVGYESGQIVLWDADQAVQLSLLQVFEEPVMCLTVWCATVNSRRVARGCCGSTSTELKSFCVGVDTITTDKSVSVTNAGFSDVCCREDAKIFATGGWDNAGRVFSAKTLRPLVVLTYHQKGSRLKCIQSS